MKQSVEKRLASGIVDHVALGLTTFGVGYLPGAPGTYGSAIAVALYLAIDRLIAFCRTGGANDLAVWASLAIVLIAFTLLGIWASGRSIPLLGNDDPSQAVVDEVIGQFITFCFVPFGLSWPVVLAGFLLFRFFDIFKPYPINKLQDLPDGLGICADDILAGVYAGICLAIGYAII